VLAMNKFSFIYGLIMAKCRLSKVGKVNFRLG
jgi:hypothetical protein